MGKKQLTKKKLVSVDLRDLKLLFENLLIPRDISITLQIV